jgi:hypothetical protein
MQQGRSKIGGGYDSWGDIEVEQPYHAALPPLQRSAAARQPEAPCGACLLVAVFCPPRLAWPPAAATQVAWWWGLGPLVGLPFWLLQHARACGRVAGQPRCLLLPVAAGHAHMTAGCGGEGGHASRHFQLVARELLSLLPLRSLCSALRALATNEVRWSTSCRSNGG